LRHDSRGGILARPARADFLPGSNESTASLKHASVLEATRILDVAFAAIALVVLSPLIVLVALAVKIESRGPVFFRCRRVGVHGRPLAMLKFRKMRDGAGGPLLTAVGDDRFTRLGGFLAKTKLDEIPQLWNVVRGEMSLVGPRPEHPDIVELYRDEYAQILRVRPGITGLSQLAFANEAEILAGDDRLQDYLNRILPQKMRLDRLYVERQSLWMNLKILAWTVATVAFQRDAAVHRSSGRLTVRRRPPGEAAPLALDLDRGV
jgi:lipopolysaccharide/colanic/teichoic acid biosynthesis glycosyltransferase